MSREIRRKGESSTFAPTPPSESLRTILSMAATSNLWMRNAPKEEGKERLHVSAIDNNSSNGGDSNHDLLKDSVFESLLRRVRRGEFLGIFAAPPCSTFSITRFQRSSSSPDGGPPVIRRRSSNQVEGIKDCPAAHVRELKRANELISKHVRSYKRHLTRELSSRSKTLRIEAIH